jgi:hypothetical protein
MLDSRGMIAGIQIPKLAMMLVFWYIMMNSRHLMVNVKMEYVLVTKFLVDHLWKLISIVLKKGYKEKEK